MQKEKIEQLLSSLPMSQASYPFGPEALVFKVFDKIFALVSQVENPPRLTLKCHPVDGANLTSQFSSIIPGYHMNKKHWVTISLDSELDHDMLSDLAEASFQLVVEKLPKKKQILLNNLSQ